MGKGRLPLAQTFMSRDGTLGSVDSFIQNAAVASEKGTDGVTRLYVVKRPGTSLFEDLGTGVDPQGAVFYNGLIYVVYNDILYRTGGAIFAGSTGSLWTQANTPVWYGRSFFTATVFQNRIYVIGGEAPFLYADVSYTSDGETWSTSAGGAPFGHRQGHQCVAFNNQLWLIGGLQNDSSAVALRNDVWSSGDGTNWTQVTASAGWTPRDNHTVVVANNGMYLYGGDSDAGAMDDVWFSADGKTWTNLTTTATGTARFVHSMLFYQNKLWIIGGFDGATALNDTWSSPDGQTWTFGTAGAWAQGRYDMAATVYNNKMWLISGVMGVTIDANVYSSTDGVNWTLVTVAPGFSNRGGAQAVTFMTPDSVNQYRYETMWLLGGNTGSVELQEVWMANLNSALASAYTLSTPTGGEQYQFNTFLNGTKLLIKNQDRFWVLESGTLTQVADTNYPPKTVPGIVVLNSFAYVMTPEGEIRSCALNDPLHWPSLQFIFADYEDDPGVAIAKYLNYLVAFGQYTIQLFYDAGNPAPGISLSPYQSTNVKVGCAFASTVQSAKNTLIWVGQTKERNLGVYIFDGLDPKRVSNVWVDKVLNLKADSGIVGWITGMEGHTFYVLNFSSGPSLVYDMDTGWWGPWSSNVEVDNAVPYSIALTGFFQNGDLWFGRGSFGGIVFRASFESLDDNGTTFAMRSQTVKIDNNNLMRKFFGQADAVCDLHPATATLEFSDDDYQSWTTWGTFDLSLMRPMLNRGGSGRRRAFRMTQTDSVAARWEAIELTASEGES